MKKYLPFLLIMFFLSRALFSQDFNQAETEHYRIQSTSDPEMTAYLGLHMEELYSRFSELTGPPASSLPKLRVIQFSSQEECYNYLQIEPSQREEPYFLLRRGLSGYSEILFFQSDKAQWHSLVHLALFQYLEACNGDSPYWIKAGLAKYFEVASEKTERDEPIPFNWSAHSRWLELYGENPPELSPLLQSEKAVPEAQEELALLSWGLVSYLMNGQGDEGRLLWETLSLIRTNRRNEWIQTIETETEEACYNYLKGLKKPDSRGTVIKDIYTNAGWDEALRYIEEENLDESWLGPYYRGLIHYERGLFSDALGDFIKAESLEAPKAEVFYSRGLCLWELGRIDEGTALIKKAEELKPGIIPDDLNRLLDWP
ncbi:MAG: hypothetical protein PQJ59_10640 [Spirochaetales bacterium]|nr:hypothetical protein [Spirochaetales bacterium]